MGIVWWQDTSKCECRRPPICEPPGGGNGGNPEAPTICGVIPQPNDDTGPPPPWTGGGGIDLGDFDVVDIPPWPPEPPRISLPDEKPPPPPPDFVWVCVQTVEANPNCVKMTRNKANADYPTLVHHGSEAACRARCGFDDIDGTDITDRPPPPPPEFVFVCIETATGQGCAMMLRVIAEENHPNKVHHATAFRCREACEEDIDDPEFVWVCLREGDEYNCTKMTQEFADQNYPGQPQHQSLLDCQIVCQGIEPPGTTDWWVCTGAPSWACNKVTLPVHIPPPQGAHLSRGGCEAFCNESVGPTSPPNIEYWMCETGPPKKCTFHSIPWHMQPPVGAYATQAQCNIDCRDEVDGPTTGGPGHVETSSTWWICDGPPTWECSKIVQADSVPPPGGNSYRSKILCEHFCNRIVGPTTPGNRHYWVCTGHPSYECEKVTQSAYIPPPQGAHLTKEACQANCHGTGPSTPGPAGPPAPKGGAAGGAGGGACKCRIVKTTLIKNPDGFPPTTGLPDNCTITNYRITYEQECKLIMNGEPRHENNADPEMNLALMQASHPIVKVRRTNVKAGFVGANCATTSVAGGGCDGPCTDLFIDYSVIVCEGESIDTGTTTSWEDEEEGGEFEGGNVTSKGAAGADTGVNIAEVGGFVDDTNNNLPTALVPNNPLDPYSGGVSRTPTKGNSNLPASPTTAPPVEADIVGLAAVPNANLPTGIGGPRNPYDSDASRTAEGFEDFLKFDPSMQIYDVTRTLLVQDSNTILQKADMRTRAFGDPGDILNERIRTVLNDILRSQGGENYVPYNGITTGAFMYLNNLVKDSLNQGTLDALETLKTQNLFSLRLDTYLEGGIKMAMLAGKLDEFSAKLMKDMANQSRSLWPRGLPQVEAANQTEAAYSLIREVRRSLNPRDYADNGNAQQTVRRTRQVCEDIDLTLAVTTRSGEITGVRFQNDDGLPITTTSGTVASPKQQNEFFSIITQDGTEDHIELNSNRDIAYAFDANQQNVIEEMLKSDTGIKLEVSSSPPSTTDIEIDPPEYATIPEILIFSSMRETITDMPTRHSGIRTTQVTYELGWKPGDPNSTLNSIVSPYVGPRATFYLPSDDPIWNYFVGPINAGENPRILLTLNSLDVPLDDKVYPRQIYTDFAIAPTNRIRYNPLQGRSELTSYETGQPIKRQMTIHPSPLQSVQNESYVKSVPDRKDISGQSTQYGMKWQKNFSDGEYTKRLSSEGEAFKTSLSSFARLYNVIQRIDDNYDITDGYHGKRIPLSDVYSFLNIKEFIDIFKIPTDIRFSLFRGAYNNIKVYPLLKDSREKTYLTAARRTGTDMLRLQKQRLVPADLPYFNPLYKGKLY
jgi:hypothetical protein